jgi:hypothetical protein
MHKPNKAERDARRARCTSLAAGKIDALESGSIGADELAEFRAAMLSGDCPLCGESDFKSIAGHIQWMHGISSRRLRDLVGFNYTNSICAPELSQKFREIHADDNPSLLGKPTTRKLSSAGRDAIAESAKKWSVNVPRPVKAEAGRKGGRENKGSVPWNKTFDHGNRAMFRQGCRCDVCAEANKAYWRKFNASRARMTATPTAGRTE